MSTETDQAQSAVFLRDGQAKQAEGLHLGDEFGGDLVFLLDPILVGYEAIPHEPAHLLPELGERFRIEGHGRLSGKL